MTISSIRPNITPAGVSSLQNGTQTVPGNAAQPLNFNQMLETLNKSESQTDALIQKLAAGEDVDLHQVMISAEETDVNFRVAIAIRDRLVDAYREVMRMAV
jgi:flagellar hook-basal body complex protein FliE